eukprot:GHVH01004341.1.p1 GENE.GHVH01004341.1~~GHVH01004341.1.p1  ORF type:complete len:536 (+),score=88.12 GHVH01004341.1:89-1609(+)
MTDVASAQASMVKRIGVIVPPDEIKAVVDKTAHFVAKNGEEFETTILQKNPTQFDFLLPESPYRAYFEKRLFELKNGIEEQDPVVPKAIADITAKRSVEAQKKKQHLALTQWGEDNVGVSQPAKSLFHVKHPYVAGVDLDVVKLTAQFVARNGQPFLIGLTQREKNPQFDFLKPTHALFQYFTSMVECYTKILKPSQEDLKKVKLMDFGADENNEPLSQKLTPFTHKKGTDIIEEWTRPSRSPDEIVNAWRENRTKQSSEKLIRDAIYQRYMWDSNEAKKAAEAEAKAAEERSANAAIDWYDFQVVATVDFDANEQYAAPMDLTTPQLPAVPMALQAAEPTPPPLGPTIMSIASTKSPPSPPIIVQSLAQKRPREELAYGPGGEQIKIVKNYDRSKAKKSFGDMMVDGKLMQKCPITGQMVTGSEMSEHLRVLLLDPQWQKEKETLLEQAQKESAFAPMGDVNANLASFVTRRPDIFGSVDDAVIELDQDDMGASDPKKARLWYQG